jgi:pimeloyl-ACP methyl ester carboxylesterase
MASLHFSKVRSWSCTIITVALVSSAAALLLNHGSTQAARARTPDDIHEAMYVSIGGIPQWLTIKGADRRNPVVLFLHGGPGDAESPFADAMYRGWDRYFTLVQWDQRGAGRTYIKSGPSVGPTMTIQRMVEDGIDVAKFLRKRLHKHKIILLGGSWGSILGIYMAHARPDLFYAYLGDAQIVNWQQDAAASYARVLELAKKAGNRQAVSDLTAIGAPPWHSLLNDWKPFRRWLRFYQAKVATAPPAHETISPAYDSPAEVAQYAAADDFNWLHFVGITMSGPLTKVNLPAIGTTFAIPIFIVQGQDDLIASPQLAHEYFNNISAPLKQFYLVAGTGHEYSKSELKLILKVLVKRVRPLVLARSKNT